MYSKPVWNVLEVQFELLLVNAQHLKNVPGRKTDVKDREWIVESFNMDADEPCGAVGSFS
jgi:transposase